MQTGLPVTLSMRRFSFADQQTFARLSGDGNPIHVDPVASRRSVVGAIVVHGIHTLLWILDVLSRSEYKPAGIHLVDVRFPKAVYLDEEVKLVLVSNTPDDMTLEATIGERVVASVRLGCLPSSRSGSEEGNSGRPEALVAGGIPKDLAFETLRGKTGIVDYAMPAQEFANAFPDAAALVGAARLRGIAACSRLVGMDCPGLRSIFSRLSVTFTTNEAAPNLSYEVLKADARFRLVRMQIVGAGLQGQIESFSPPASPQQLAMDEIAGMVGRDEFAGQTALVVGGSRGLGELTAKAIAAGGGRVFLTYTIGKADADRVAEEIRAFGGRAHGIAYDVTKVAYGQLAQLRGAVPTHIYYFATCKIFRSKTEAFEPVVLDEFMAFYVRGFYDLCRSLWDHEAKQLSVFYPSSVAVEERPRDLTEYAMAKAAGEVLCADLPRIMPGLRVLVKRLPRLLTDQTTSVASQDLPRSIDTMLPIVREMK